MYLEIEIKNWTPWNRRKCSLLSFPVDFKPVPTELQEENVATRQLCTGRGIINTTANATNLQLAPKVFNYMEFY